MKKLFVLLALAPMACVQATVSDSLTISEPFSYSLPDIPAGTVIPETSLIETDSVPLDVSDAVSKLSSLGTLSFSISGSYIVSSLNLDFVSHIQVFLSEQSGGSPLPVVDTDVNTSGETTNLPVLASSDNLLSYLSSGPTTLTVYLTVETANLPTGGPDLSLQYHLSLNASESVSKSL
jgi:hypothetical protein